MYDSIEKVPMLEGLNMDIIKDFNIYKHNQEEINNILKNQNVFFNLTDYAENFCDKYIEDMNENNAELEFSYILIAKTLNIFGSIMNKEEYIGTLLSLLLLFVKKKLTIITNEKYPYKDIFTDIDNFRLYFDVIKAIQNNTLSQTFNIKNEQKQCFEQIISLLKNIIKDKEKLEEISNIKINITKENAIITNNNILIQNNIITNNTLNKKIIENFNIYQFNKKQFDSILNLVDYELFCKQVSGFYNICLVDIEKKNKFEFAYIITAKMLNLNISEEEIYNSLQELFYNDLIILKDYNIEEQYRLFINIVKSLQDNSLYISNSEKTMQYLSNLQQFICSDNIHLLKQNLLTSITIKQSVTETNNNINPKISKKHKFSLGIFSKFFSNKKTSESQKIQETEVENSDIEEIEIDEIIDIKESFKPIKKELKKKKKKCKQLSDCSEEFKMKEKKQKEEKDKKRSGK